MSLGTKIYTWLKGNLVGSDDLGINITLAPKILKI